MRVPCRVLSAGLGGRCVHEKDEADFRVFAQCCPIGNTMRNPDEDRRIAQTNVIPLAHSTIACRDVIRHSPVLRRNHQDSPRPPRCRTDDEKSRCLRAADGHA
jgi:hypothetical protein